MQREPIETRTRRSLARKQIVTVLDMNIVFRGLSIHTVFIPSHNVFGIPLMHVPTIRMDRLPELYHNAWCFVRLTRKHRTQLIHNNASQRHLFNAQEVPLISSSTTLHPVYKWNYIRGVLMNSLREIPNAAIVLDTELPNRIDGKEVHTFRQGAVRIFTTGTRRHNRT